MARQAIRNEGAAAEQAFLELVLNSRPSDSAKQGDAIVTVDGIDTYVEIKYVTSNTINQVRAIKFIPLVIYSPQRIERPWAVLPAQEVVRMVLPKDRGQHTEIALECASLSLSRVNEVFRSADTELDDVVRDAIRATRRYPKLGQLLSQLLQGIRFLNQTYQGSIEAALHEGDLT